MNNDFDFNFFIDLLGKIAEIPARPKEESARINFIQNFLSSRDIESYSDNAGNLWVPLIEGKWGDTVVFDAHVDVVGKGYCDFIKNTGETICGTGVFDNLTAVTMLMLLAISVKNKEINPARPFKLLFSVGEEALGNLRGMKQIVSEYQDSPRYFIAWDLDYTNYSVCCIGSHRYQVVINTSGGHSWQEFGNPNSIEIMVDILSGIKQIYKKLVKESKDFMSFNMGTISGGEDINCIADYCCCSFEFRSESQDILNIMDKQLNQLLESYNLQKKVLIKINQIGNRPAAKQYGTFELEKQVKKIWKQNKISLKCKPRSLNINLPLSENWPSIGLGLCEGGNAHSDNEFVKISSIPNGWTLLLAITEELLK